MHLSDRKLNRIQATPSASDADEFVKAMAREIQTMRAEIRQLKQTFVPIVAAVDPRSRDFFLAFNVLCQEHKTRAAAVVPYEENGMMLLHVAGEMNTALLVRGMMAQEKEGDEHG